MLFFNAVVRQKVYELECKQCFPTVVASDSVKKQLMKYLILLVRKYIKWNHQMSKLYHVSSNLAA